MSVPKYKRNESGVEFLNTYHDIRKEVIMILMRDLGIKKKTQTVKFLLESYEVEEYDREVLIRIMDKYGMSEVEIDQYGAWIIDKWKEQLMTAIDRLGIEIELANNIHITNREEYVERRKPWDLAIGWCHVLKNKLQEIVSCINVKVGAYEIVIGRLWSEIRLLKGVRKSDNAVLKTLPPQ